MRLISFLDRPYYYGAKKKYLDWIASRQLATGRYDLFHSWSGDCLQSLRVTSKLGIPSIVEIPTWHRDRGKVGERPAADVPARSSRSRRWKENLLQTRERFLEEYELADMLFVLSQKAADTFRVQGFSEEKLFYLPRGVDVERFKPGVRPPIFRAVFSGALIERKGIHHLLEAWHRLDLKDAELWLVGSVHDEAKPHLKKYWRDNIKVVGFVRDVENYLSQGTVHVFPSQCEGSAKVTYEAAACGSAANHHPRSGGRGHRRRRRELSSPPEMSVNWRRRFSSFTGIRTTSSGWAWRRASAWSKTSPGTTFASGCSVPTSWRWEWHDSLPAPDPDHAPDLVRTESGRIYDQDHEQESMNILLIQLKRIGDLILTTPAIAALREKFPDANISLVVSPAVEELLPAISGVDKVFVAERESGRCARLDRAARGEL